MRPSDPAGRRHCCATRFCVLWCSLDALGRGLLSGATPPLLLLQNLESRLSRASVAAAEWGMCVAQRARACWTVALGWGCRGAVYSFCAWLVPSGRARGGRHKPTRQQWEGGGGGKAAELSPQNSRLLPHPLIVLFAFFSRGKTKQPWVRFGGRRSPFAAVTAALAARAAAGRATRQPPRRQQQKPSGSSSSKTEGGCPGRAPRACRRPPALGRAPTTRARRDRA